MPLSMRLGKGFETGNRNDFSDLISNDTVVYCYVQY